MSAIVRPFNILAKLKTGRIHMKKYFRTRCGLAMLAASLIATLVSTPSQAQPSGDPCADVVITTYSFTGIEPRAWNQFGYERSDADCMATYQMHYCEQDDACAAACAAAGGTDPTLTLLGSVCNAHQYDPGPPGMFATYSTGISPTQPAQLRCACYICNPGA